MPHKYKQIQGWFDEGFARVYDKIIEECPDQECVIEVGSWKGCSSVYFLEKCKEINIPKYRKTIDFYCIDRFTGDEYGINGENGTSLPEFYNNIKEAGFCLSHESVTPYSCTAIVLDSIKASKEFFDNSLFAVMLDGNHCTEYVSTEIDVWLPKIKSGGILAFHDYLDPNLRRLFNQKLSPIEDYESCGLYRVV